MSAPTHAPGGGTPPPPGARTADAGAAVPANAALPGLVDPPGQWITLASGERIFMVDQPPATLPAEAALAAMPVLVDPPGQWITFPSGERIFMVDQPPAAAPADAALAAMPVLVDPPGHWTTLPSGERIFMVAQASAASTVPEEPAMAGAGAEASALAGAAPGWASTRGGFARSPAAERIFVADDEDDEPGSFSRSRSPAPARRVAMAAGGADEAPEVELQGEGLSDIVSLVPGRLARSGIGVICGVSALLFALSAVIRYPEVV